MKRMTISMTMKLMISIVDRVSNPIIFLVYIQNVGLRCANPTYVFKIKRVL
jgi:hypothetical protein